MIAKMMMGRGVLAAALLIPAAVPSAWAQKPGSAIPLKVTFDNASGYSITGLPDAETADPAYYDALDNVRAEITYGNFYFDTNEMKGDGGRRVRIDLGLCAEGTEKCPVDPETGIPYPQDGSKDVYLATVNSGCDVDDLASMPAGNPCDKRLAISWVDGAYTYYLRYDWGAGREGSPYDGRVEFTCNASGGGKCTNWSASPIPSPNPESLDNTGLYAKLTRKSSGEVYLRSLNVTFGLALEEKR